jgi:hypothetical protein
MRNRNKNKNKSAVRKTISKEAGKELRGRSGCKIT